MTDTSKIVVGSRVTFVMDDLNVKLIEAGVNLFVELDQIISIEPPVFDWSSVKPGMRFRNGIGDFCFYIGPAVYTDDFVVVSKFLSTTSNSNLSYIEKSDLTPAPEGDNG